MSSSCRYLERTVVANAFRRFCACRHSRQAHDFRSNDSPAGVAALRWLSSAKASTPRGEPSSSPSSPRRELVDPLTPVAVLNRCGHVPCRSPPHRQISRPHLHSVAFAALRDTMSCVPLITAAREVTDAAASHWRRSKGGTPVGSVEATPCSADVEGRSPIWPTQPAIRVDGGSVDSVRINQRVSPPRAPVAGCQSWVLFRVARRCDRVDDIASMSPSLRPSGWRGRRRLHG